MWNFSKQGRTEQTLGSTWQKSKNSYKKVLLVSRPYQFLLKELVKSYMQDITLVKCPTTLRKSREIGDAFGKNNIFLTLSLYLHPSLLKIRALPPCQIYVFGMNRIWAILCKTFDEFALKLNILWCILERV